MWALGSVEPKESRPSLNKASRPHLRSDDGSTGVGFLVAGRAAGLLVPAGPLRCREEDSSEDLPEVRKCYKLG